MRPALRRELALAGARALLATVVLVALAEFGDRRIRLPLASVGYVGALAGLASLVEGRLRRRERVWPWVPVAWLAALALVGLAHLEAVYASGVFEGGLTGGHEALRAELARLTAPPPARRHVWFPPAMILSVFGAGAAVALATASTARPLAQPRTRLRWDLLSWVVAFAACFLTATVTVTAVSALLEPQKSAGIGLVLWVGFLIGVVATPATVLLCPTWLLTARLLPREPQQEQGLPPVPSAA